MRVAFAGAAHSHPFADAANLAARGAQLIGMWDADDADRRDDFAARFPVPVFTGLPELLAERPDVVVATPRTPRAVDIALACAAADVPVFFNKTVAADAEGLARWEALPEAPRFTSSVLRFAPELVAFAGRLPSRPRAIEVHAQHDIAGFLTAGRSWQDSPSGAGGTMVNIGVHAWEMLDVLLPGVTVEMLSATRVTTDGTASELLATVHARADGIPVMLAISGVAGADRYAVRTWHDEGLRELVLPHDADGLGYGGVADAVLRLGAGTVPVDATRTSAVYRNAIAAADLARTCRGRLGT
ncbi:Gfo/Idh/MocA family oxidoreductase [Microbacterium sp. NPDC057659]|uniref:Gfo/Idh/MocA family oxidoreductase n=1 Tax=Microbacterium sp. NPDC057659 TaxID=3346198 RepID=UPI0036708C2B